MCDISSFLTRSKKRLPRASGDIPNDCQLRASFIISFGSGTTGKGTSLFTLSHELVHDLKIKNIKGYNRLGDFLEQQYVEKGKSVDEIVKDYQNKLGSSYNEAYEEWVADSCEVMLTTAVEGNTSVLNQLKNKCYDIWLKLREVITKFAKIISKEYSNIKPDSEAGRFVADMDKATLKLMHQMYIEEIAKAGEASQYFDGVDDMLTFMEEHNISAEGTYLEQYKNKNTAYNDGVKNMIRHTQDGKSYVMADRQVIKGDDVSKWGSQVTNYINDNIRKGKDVVVYAKDGDALTITRDTAGKARFRNNVRLKDGTTRPMTDEEYTLKLRAETHIDELSEVSKRGKKDVPDTKNHNFAKDGFNYRTAYFMDFDGTYYRLTLSVGKNGIINTVYNVGKIKEEDKYSLSGSKPVAKKTATMRSSSSNKSIPQDDAPVNNQSMQEDEKKSLRDNEYLEAVNNGDVISLSERFNEQNEDVRYSTRDYSYESLINKPDMKVTIINDNISYDVNSQTRKNLANKPFL